MKQGTSLITFVMVAVAAALAIYFGFYVFDTFNDPFTTTLAYTYTAQDSVETDGLLVRAEQVLPAQSGIVDMTRGEGERVGVGQTVALVYRDSQAQADQAELDGLNLEIELLEDAAVDSGSVASAARLDEDILQSLVSLRSSAALGDFSHLEDQVMSVKSNVLKRGYTYGDGMTSGDLSARLQDLKSRYSTLCQQNASATTQVTASKSGTFSTMIDGYESILTPETMLQLTPSTLKPLLSGTDVTAGQGIGKLITSDRWYFVTSLPSDVAGRLKENGDASLRFTGDFSQDVDMRVDKIGPAEGNDTLVIFSSDRYMDRTTLLRQQTAALIFDSWSGLRVPKGALRMVKIQRDDKETGQAVEENHLGVYVLLAGRAEFKPVDVITEGSDYFVVQATSFDRTAFRAGDEVIVRATGLYDGELLEY
ncbi:MAG: HlyD family efflux transporter periplasmic adaptor subunit [Lawsonibacter sp.]|nr:HlyD family efflux transporter periplasmic adaptor subunit [Lawsonibacter sp.]